MTFDRHSGVWFQCSFEVWAPWLSPTPDNWRWRGPYNMEFYEAQTRNHVSYRPQVHSARVDITSRFPSLAATKACCNSILAYLVHCRLQNHRRLSLRNYMDFLKRSLRKVYQQARTRPKQGRYLGVLDSPYLWCYVLNFTTSKPTARKDTVHAVFHRTNRRIEQQLGLFTPIAAPLIMSPNCQTMYKTGD